MPVYGKAVKRRDKRFIRGDTQRFGGHWWQRNVRTGESWDVDLSDWSGVIELYSLDDELWYAIACSEMSVDGRAIATIPPSAFTGSAWDSRRHGTWRCRVTSPDGGTVKTIGWGYWILTF